MQLITLASFKGGVGKSTSAIHLAEYFTRHGSVLLVDSDPNRTALRWHGRCDRDYAFEVADIDADVDYTAFDFVVLDTPGRPDEATMRSLDRRGNFLVLPSSPDAFALEAVLATASELRTDAYAVLLSICPPAPSRAADDARELLQASGVNVFSGRVRRYAAYEKAAIAGTVVRDSGDRYGRIAWSDYQSIGDELWQLISS